MEREAGVLLRHRPPPLGAARGSEACVGTHAALCRCSGGEAGEGSRGSQAGDATLPAGARRAVLPRARSPGLARIPPSASRPPSSSPLGSRPRSTSLIFSKLPLPRALCAPGAWRWVRGRVPHPGIAWLQLWWAGTGTLDFSHV